MRMLGVMLSLHVTRPSSFVVLVLSKLLSKVEYIHYVSWDELLNSLFQNYMLWNMRSCWAKGSDAEAGKKSHVLLSED
eukprot:scaffold62365_cov44-Cyclotella_meneghiniana.AAC.8